MAQRTTLLRPRALAPAAALMVLLTALSFTPARAAAVAYDVDPEHTSIGFKVKHLFSKVPGRFNDFEGTIWIDKEDYTKSRVELTIQAASIDTDQTQRDNHLRSDAFFDVKNHPTITFKSTEVRKEGEDRLAVVGDLTIRGVTKKVTLNVEVLGYAELYSVERAAFEATTRIDRTEYNVSWNDVVEGGGVLLGHDVDITINLQAKKRKDAAS